MENTCQEVLVGDSGCSKKSAYLEDYNVSSSIDEKSTNHSGFFVGMTFKNGEEAYNSYNEYAYMKGFGIRKGNKRHKVSGELSRCWLVCSCEGKSSTRAPNEIKQRQRYDYRSGCRASLQFIIREETWEVSYFCDDHNHPMVEDHQKHFISSGRKLNDSMKTLIGSLVDNGIKPKAAFKFVSNQAGGVQNLGFTEQNAKNWIQQRRKCLISGGDAQSLINHFKDMQAEDSQFFYTFQLDDEGRMCNFFWRDGISRLQYECFGDVVTFDTTYRTNRYNMVCAPFVGVNNHWHNIYFGCAFLGNETIESFEWLFKVFLDSMGGKAPITFFTDQDAAMANAIKSVMPSTHHRLCEWHIEKNAAQRIPYLYTKAEFRDKYFSKLLWRCQSETDFESTWTDMVKVWKVSEDSWLQRLYSIKEKWSPAFNRNIFSADIRSTQRSESTNNVFTSMSCKTMTLTEFVRHYESKCVDVRNDEAGDDHTSRGLPKLVVDGIGILEHAGSVYTCAIFKKFQNEFLKSMRHKVLTIDYDGTKRTYTLCKDDGQHTKIEYDPSTHSIVCDCHMFDTLGLLCSHVLRVLHFELAYDKIPSKYVLKRWTKCAKHGIDFSKYNHQREPSLSSPLSFKLNDLMRKSFAVMSLGASDDISFDIASRHLDNAKNEIIQHQIKSVDGCPTQNESHISNTGLENAILDPATRRKKGDSWSRKKSVAEKKKRKSVCKTSTSKTKDGVKAQDHATVIAPPMDAFFNNMASNSSHLQQGIYSGPSLSFMQLLQNSTNYAMQHTEEHANIELHVQRQN